MPPVPPCTGRRTRRLRPLLVAAVAVLTPFALPVAASAESAGGETVVGELVQVWPEELGGHSAHDAAGLPLTWVETAGGDAVRVPTEEVAGLPVGATVEVTLGASVDDDAAAEHDLDPARSVLAGEVRSAAPAAGPTPSNSVTVVRVVPAGGVPDDVTLASLVAAVDGPVAEFWAGQTGGAVRFGVTSAHPDWVPTPATCADPTALWDAAAAASGFQPGPGRHLLVYVSSRPADLAGCAVAMGQVGSGPGAGGRAYVRTVLPSLIAHEFGHNLGLGHSSGHQCDGTLETGSCRTAGYRDYYDVMGASWEHVGSLNVAQAARLGVLPAGSQQVLAVGDSAATVVLAPLSGTSGTRALRLDAPTGGAYWLEYRAAGGWDGWLAGDDNRFGLDAGVLLRRAGEHTDTALLLDGSPSAAAGWDDDLRAALPVGVPVPVGGGTFTVTVQAMTDAGATLLVQPAAHPVPAAPAGPGTGGTAPDVLPGDARGTAGAAPAAAGPATGDAHAVEIAAGSGSAPGSDRAAAAAAVGTDQELAPQSRSTSSLWLLPLLTGLAVTGVVLAASRGVRRFRLARG